MLMPNNISNLSLNIQLSINFDNSYLDSLHLQKYFSMSKTSKYVS